MAPCWAGATLTGKAVAAVGGFNDGRRWSMAVVISD
ncbi:hypothetical protein COLO4_21586 [Corchorus olitorius]|uniref:Uncharacterized protein n=1 Tax=Corchorus olitorius TaxID=93759 RepID=A0A1R3ISF3_9ROSI|nr:hypothetical protein COLO4_21586 [Corchorus olitorius]